MLAGAVSPSPSAVRGWDRPVVCGLPGIGTGCKEGLGSAQPCTQQGRKGRGMELFLPPQSSGPVGEKLSRPLLEDRR